MIKFQTPYYEAREETAEVDGVQKTYHVVDFGRSAGVLLFDPTTEKILLTRQFRQLLKDDSLEIPGGMVDSEESFHEAAVRETIEETGFKPLNLQFLANYYPGLDNVDNETEIFIATEFEKIREFKSQPGEIRSITWMDLPIALQKIKQREIRDVSTILAILATSALIGKSKLNEKYPSYPYILELSAVKLNIIIPSFNEAENIDTVINETQKAFRTLTDSGGDYRLLFIENGSTDNSIEILKARCQQDPKVSYISLSRNFGYQGAIAAGLAHLYDATHVAIMDGDLQDPPHVLYRMLDQLIVDRCDVVYGVKVSRVENLVRRSMYKFFYKIFDLMSSTKLNGESGEFCVITRRVATEINRLQEIGRFHRGLRSWVGFKQSSYSYDRDGRHSGSAKFTFRSSIALALEGIFSFTVVPLRSVSLVGVIIFLFASAAFALQAISKVLTLLGFNFVERFTLPPGLTLVSLSIYIFFGVTILILGIISEYLSILVNESKKRPNFIVSEYSKNIENRQYHER